MSYLCLLLLNGFQSDGRLFFYKKAAHPEIHAQLSLKEEKKISFVSVLFGCSINSNEKLEGK